MNMTLRPSAVFGFRAGIRLLLLFTLLCPFFAAPAVTAGDHVPAELAVLIDEAMANNQELAAIADKVEGMHREAPAAGSLPDPMAGIALANVPIDSFEFDQEPMTQKQIFASQKVPWFGTLDLAEQNVHQGAVGQEKMLMARRLSLARQVSETWYDLIFIDHNLDLNASLTSIITQVLKVAETRYGTGMGLQQDILSAQVQLSELMEEDTALTAKKQMLAERLSGLLNRRSTYESERIGLAMPPELAVSGEELAGQALAANPLLLARRTAVDKARTEVALAEKAYMPDMDFRLTYGQRDDTPAGADRPDFLSVGVAFSVPLWQGTKQDNKLAAARKRLLAAQKEVLDLERTLPHRIDAILADLDGTRDNHRLFSEVLAVQAEQLADSSLSAYSVGKLEFDTMLAAQIKLLKIKLKSDRFIFETRKKLAELTEVVGVPLTFNEER